MGRKPEFHAEARTDAREFALTRRVLLIETRDGVGVDAAYDPSANQGVSSRILRLR
jgi:hypothetical protein